MTEFFDKTWLFWWVFCAVVILWWSHRVFSMGGVEGEIEPIPTKTSALPSPERQIPDHPSSRRNRRRRFSTAPNTPPTG